MAVKRETTITKWVGNSDDQKPDGNIAVGFHWHEVYL